MLVKIESESERLIAGSHWILNRTVAMGMNCGTGLGAVRLKNLKSKVATLQWWRRRTATKIKQPVPTRSENPHLHPSRPVPVTRTDMCHTTVIFPMPHAQIEESRKFLQPKQKKGRHKEKILSVPNSCDGFDDRDQAIGMSKP